MYALPPKFIGVAADRRSGRSRDKSPACTALSEGSFTLPYGRCIRSASIQLASSVVRCRQTDIKSLCRQFLVCDLASPNTTNMLSQFSNVFLVCLSIFDSAIAAPKLAADRYSIKERHNVPPGWKKIGAVPDSHSISLHIGLAQNNQAEIGRHALEASDPSHPGYGQYLSAGEIQKLIAPSDETIEMVSTWLTEHDIIAASLSPSKDWITANVPVRKVESLLNTTYSVYQHRDGSTLIRAPDWSLPQNLHDRIDLIQPTNSFFRTSKLTSDAMPERGSIEWHKPWNNGWWNAPKHHVSDS